MFRALDSGGQTINFLLSPGRMRPLPGASFVGLWDNHTRSILGPLRWTERLFLIAAAMRQDGTLRRFAKLPPQGTVDTAQIRQFRLY
jgi:hypothetical protein